MSLRADTHASYQVRISRALVWLEGHLGQEVSAPDLARVAAFSPHHFHRVFRGVTGETVNQCTRRLRLESAARKLRRTDATVLEIALTVGFGSHEGFSRAFRSHFGSSPSAFRQSPDPIQSQVDPLELDFSDVTVRTVPAFDLCFSAHRGSFSDVPAAWGSFLGEAGQQGLFTGQEPLMGRYPDDPDITPEGSVRFEVGVRSSFDVKPPLFKREVPAGRWAVAIHRGSYDDLHNTYLRLVGGWFPSTGTPLADGSCMEAYLNLPHEVAPDDLVTEVWAPIGTGVWA